MMSRVPATHSAFRQQQATLGAPQPFLWLSRVRNLVGVRDAVHAVLGRGGRRANVIFDAQRPRRFVAPDGPSEVGPSEVGPSEVGPAEVGPAAVGPAEVGPAEVGPAEVGPAEVGPAEVGPAEVGPAEVGPAEVGPAEVGLAEAGSRR